MSSIGALSLKDKLSKDTCPSGEGASTTDFAHKNIDSNCVFIVSSNIGYYGASERIRILETPITDVLTF